MVCGTCGKTIMDGTGFCPFCGSRQGGAVPIQNQGTAFNNPNQGFNPPPQGNPRMNVQNAQNGQMPEDAQEQESKGPIIAIAVAAALIVLLIGFGGVYFFMSSGSSSKTASYSGGGGGGGSSTTFSEQQQAAEEEKKKQEEEEARKQKEEEELEKAKAEAEQAKAEAEKAKAEAEAEKAKAKAASTPTDSSYLIPDSAYDYVDPDTDLAPLTHRECWLARNEIYARNGYIFSNSELRAYFGNKTWYTPRSDFSESWLGTIEKENVQTIKDYERDVWGGLYR